jgi:hypothetical protein
MSNDSEMNGSVTNGDKQNPYVTEVDANKMKSEYLKQVELLSNWYQANYLWTINYLNSSSYLSAINSPLMTVNNQSFVQPCEHTHHIREQSTRQQQPRQTPNILSYKVPTLYKRFLAEIVDAIIIQLFKVLLAVLLINFTDIM